MFWLTIKTEDTTKRVRDAADKANFRNFNHAAASIRKDALSTLERSEGASQPGTPPHTRKGLAKRALRYDADKTGAVIGFAYGVIGTAMSAHELGGEYKGEHYPQRATVGPALDRAAPRLAGEWSGTIGQ